MANLKAEIARRSAADPLLSEPPRYRHPTWGGFMQEGGAGVQWIIGAPSDWRIRYEALRDRAGDVADDGHEAANRRKAAERLKGLVATYLALATPAPGLALQILRGDAALKHIEATDRTGLEMQALALRLGLASVDAPAYVSVQTVRNEHLERMLARQRAIAAESTQAIADGLDPKPQAPSQDRPTHDERLARVLACIKSNPDLSEREIGRLTGVPPSTFRGWPETWTMRKMLAGAVPRGHKTRDGDIEAYTRG